MLAVTTIEAMLDESAIDNKEGYTMANANSRVVKIKWYLAKTMILFNDNIGTEWSIPRINIGTRTVAIFKICLNNLTSSGEKKFKGNIIIRKFKNREMK